MNRVIGENRLGTRWLSVAGGMRCVHDCGVSCLIRGVSGTLAGSSSEVSDGDATLGWPWDAADRVFGPYAMDLGRSDVAMRFPRPTDIFVEGVGHPIAPAVDAAGGGHDAAVVAVEIGVAEDVAPVAARADAVLFAREEAADEFFVGVEEGVGEEGVLFGGARA